MSNEEKGAAPEPHVDLWSREGFVGTNAITLRPAYTPEYIAVEGLHAPRRIQLSDVPSADEADASALPTTLMRSRRGVTLSVSRRRAPMPFTFRNVDADELHFIQSGTVRYETEFGALDAAAMDLVAIPRSVAYRVVPRSQDLLALIMESPEPLAFDTPAPFGMINFDLHVRRAKMPPPGPPPAGAPEATTHTLILKAEDGLTRFTRPADPLGGIAQIGGQSPVWALGLADIQPVSYGGLGGPPAQFLAARDTSMMFFSLSARASKLRPPIHHNADFDELILYASGPGAWGDVREPGTLCHTPKGVTHHGPSEDVPEGYLALLLETRATMRFTPEVVRWTKLMETSQYGIHPSNK